MNSVRIGPDEHKTITDALGDIHIRLDHIRAAMEYLYMTAYHTEPLMSPISQTAQLIIADQRDMVASLSDLIDEIRIA